MKVLRVIDPAGNKRDYETEHVPCIGERIQLSQEYFRVKDVMYVLDNPGNHQASILIEEETDAEAVLNSENL